jgi:FlaA1/EpsC-like NDP-sugar epimerase
MKTPKEILRYYFNRSMLPIWAIVLFDCGIVYCSILLASVMRYGAFSLVVGGISLQLIFIGYLFCYILGFILFRTYTFLIRYTTFSDLLRVIGACLFSGLLVFSVRWYVRGDAIGSEMFYSLMRNVFATTSLSCFFLCLMRLIVRGIYNSVHFYGISYSVLIYGEKETAVVVANSIRHDAQTPMRIQGFLSDNEKLMGRYILGKRIHVLSTSIISTLDNCGANAIVVCPDKADKFRDNTELIDKLAEANIKIFMVSNITEYGKDENPQKRLHEFSIDDMLYRDPIKIDMTPIASTFEGSSIMITGAAGSIGSEIVRQLARLKPAHLILIDQAETPMHDMRLYLLNNCPEIEAETIVTSIVNQQRMEHIFKTYKPDYIMHAAAYKHVPMMEDNATESIQNNLRGTEIIADLAVKYGVKKFVMVSTDKAVNPTNIMGCSKRLCEIYVQSLDKYLKQTKTGHTQFVTTRFGNVLGSNGSVIPLFKKQIAEGGPVTVTDPNIIRYFMTISEACNLVLEASCMGSGGEIYVFDMGKPVKIVDLAKRMIHLSGAKNVSIKFIGLRDGEKLYEELLSASENNKPTPNEKIQIASVREYDYQSVKDKFKQLIDDSYKFDESLVVKEMMELVPEYVSTTPRFAKLKE